MKSVSTYAMTGVLVAMAMAIGVRVSAEPRVALTIRLYNTSSIPATELLAARRAIEATFQDTGLDLILRHCGRPVLPHDAADSCSESLKPMEMVVRIIVAPSDDPTTQPEACGVAYILRETDRGWLASAFSDRVADAATRVGVDAGTLLGLVIAHELGHLLLGSGYHSWTGVMRADWPKELRDHNGGPWRFSTLEAARMRQAAASRF
jgi:hypothetical protein